MAGIPKRVVVINVNHQGNHTKLALINPEIIKSSATTQTIEEASLSFPGISADITRPDAVTVRYMDLDGQIKEFEAQGVVATVIQHELDYLDGKTFLDYLSKLKRDLLVSKMLKYIKMHPPHVHGEHCDH